MELNDMTDSKKTAKATKAAAKSKAQVAKERLAASLPKKVPADAMSKTMLKSVLVAANIDRAVARETAKKDGIYVTFTQLAADSNQEEFEKAAAVVIKCLKHNVGGAAVKAKCEKNERSKGQYKIPSAVSSAVSTLKACYKYGLPMLDAETGAPMAFTALRESAKVARELEKEAAIGPELEHLKMARATLAETVEAIAGNSELDAMQGAMLVKLVGVLEGWQKEYAAISTGEEEPTSAEPTQVTDDPTDAELDAILAESDAAVA